MKNGDKIRNSDNDTLAAFLHMIEAGAIICSEADSVEVLREWLDEEEKEDDNEHTRSD